MSPKVKTHQIDIYAGNKSVSDVSAPFVKKCESGYTGNKEVMAIESILSQLRNNGGLYYAILLMQLRGALRISEVLNIDHQDLIDKDKIFIRGLKGSENKLIHVPELEGLIIKWKLNKMQPFVNISRHSVYRFYKRLGISSPKVKSKLSNVTHAPRNIVIRSLRKSNMTNAEISAIIGHKAKKSLEYYG